MIPNPKEPARQVLIVEDDAAIMDALGIILREAGYQVTGYADGEMLLGGNFTMPHLFVLDRQLAGIDGLDLCRHLKAQAESGNIPVLLLSASPQMEKFAKAAGANGFMEKPFRRQALLETVKRLLKENALAGAAQ